MVHCLSRGCQIAVEEEEAERCRGFCTGAGFAATLPRANGRVNLCIGTLPSELDAQKQVDGSRDSAPCTVSFTVQLRCDATLSRFTSLVDELRWPTRRGNLCSHVCNIREINF